MTRKPSPAVFLSEDLKNFLDAQDDGKIRQWIDDMSKVLKENMYAGDLVGKSLIPSKYKDIFGVNNLYRYPHPEGFRSCYTIFSERDLGPCPHILDVINHDEYDRIFGYRRTR